MIKFHKSHYFGILVGLIIIVCAYLFLKGERSMLFVMVLGVVFGSIPFIISILTGQSDQREKEEQFLAFSRDLVENVKSGTPISKSIVNLIGRNYGTLTYHTRKLANQLSIGITLNSALETFAKESKSRVIARAVTLISEAERAGGNIDTILESVAMSVNQTEDLRKERKASVANLVTQGYMIFLIFIIIMLVLEFKILPLLGDLGSTKDLGVSSQNITADQFTLPLLVMLIVQAIFAGLVIGKVSEGEILKGIKHSFILLTLTLLISTGSKALFGA